LMKRLAIKDDFNFSRALIEKTGVATVPGTSFYANSTKGGKKKGGNQIRFAYCKKMETLHKVRERLLEIV